MNQLLQMPIRPVLLVTLIFTLSGCGLMGDPRPPNAYINGRAGTLTDYCWINVCADGFGAEGPDGLPLVSRPLELTLPEGSRLGDVTAYTEDQRGSYPVSVDGGELGEIPADAALLNVFLQFPDITDQHSGDASYWWQLGP